MKDRRSGSRKRKTRERTRGPASEPVVAAIPDDIVLTRSGAEFAASRRARQLVIACGALAREILAVLRLNGIDHVDLACLPAQLHNRPERIPGALRSRIRRARNDGYERIAVAYADCGTGGRIDEVCASEGVDRIAGPHCYAFYDGVDRFAARVGEEIGAFYLTDFLVRQFDAIVWKGLGLDRHPELRDLYFGNYDRVVYLAQTENSALEAAAMAAADRLQLRYEKRFTGYGELAGFLRGAAA